ncbi:MAG: FAD-dependent oxidoreductase [Clostridia bacterium]|nr:FAD-dependent oxidoreductase [Clostridia bacterium]
MPESIWNNNFKTPEHKELCGDIKTDVLIIGGGICGLLCAYFLNKNGVDCVVAEGSRLCSGITKNTTAKITSLHGLIYDKLIKTSGKDIAQMYLDANNNALARYRELSKVIDCDFEEKSAYTYSISDRQKIEDEVDAVLSLGETAEFKEDISLPFETEGAICFPNQAQFNPLKFANGISKGLKIFENTFIRDISKHTALSDKGKITADKIIVATHFPFINKHGLYFLKLYQHRSYVIALKGAADVDGMYVDEAEDGLSFRNFGDLLLIGGGSHRTGKKGGNWTELRRFANQFYPLSEEEYHWSTQDCMSLDKIPYIGRYSGSTPDLFVASGFNKWGMTSSMAAAEILCDLVLGKENDFSRVFNPSRSILKPQLAVNGVETIFNFLSPTVKRCPHLGCALKYNKREHSWDCPCHGSRFDERGKLIDNPATGDAKV